MAGKRKAAGINKGKRTKKFRHDQDQLASKVTNTYTSELPGDVISQILCLLSTKNAVRASILTKEWRRVWSISTFPVLDFDEDEIEQGSSLKENHNWWEKRRKFFTFVNRWLKQRENDKSDIEKFRLRMCYSGGTASMLKWLTFAVDRKVKELEICCLNQRGKKPFYLPHSTLIDAKCLAVLKLENMIVKNIPDTSSFPSLKTLSLKKVEFEGHAFQQLFAGCPSIEHLLMISCGGRYIQNLQLSSLTLKSLEVSKCFVDLIGFRVEAVNLETIKCSGFRRFFDSGFFDIFSCHNIKNIELSGTNLTNQWFQGFYSSFPLLESLILDQCPCSTYVDKRNNILSRRPPLKHFEWSCPKLVTKWRMIRQ